MIAHDVVDSLRIASLHLRDTSQHPMRRTPAFRILRPAMTDLLKNKVTLRILFQICFLKDPLIIGFMPVQIPRQQNIFRVPDIKHYEIPIPYGCGIICFCRSAEDLDRLIGSKRNWIHRSGYA